MTLHIFEHGSELPCSAEEAYAWHARPGALQRLIPPWEGTRIVGQQGDLSNGAVRLEVPVGPLRGQWVARHRDAIPGRRFVAEQTEGPFAHWVHEHLFEPAGVGSCSYRDRVTYALPLGRLGELAGGIVARRLTRAFRYRHATVRADLETHHRAGHRGAMTIAITGATGLLGRQLVAFLSSGGHRIRRLVRRNPGPDDIRWNPATGGIDADRLEGVDAVVHLAGEPIAKGRWTADARRRILGSRTQGTTLLAETLARLAHPPRVLVSASGVGIYGDRGAERLTEESPLRAGPEASFVERVGHAWEAAAAPAERSGIRVVRLRIGIVLTPAGGALARMLPPFRAGVGGRLGDGTQYVSWIGMDDLLGAIHHAILTDSLRGPLNATGPEPATNAALTESLGGVLGRPTVCPVPATILRLAFGAMADELLLASTRVEPARLLASGYRFRHPTLRDALRHVLGR